ncbi:hypothetical protein HAX54_003595 [Datura stramonium]|uniref:Uncharacterized protein n=1 Tax=Datura stramonium TaxID=4076 RepID=A0ABS8T6S8_DATST|nr:hypothetical protein [Datura stramonium]
MAERGGKMERMMGRRRKQGQGGHQSNSNLIFRSIASKTTISLLFRISLLQLNQRLLSKLQSQLDAMWRAGLNKLFSDIKIRGKVAVGLNPNIRFYRYKAGQRL